MTFKNKLKDEGDDSSSYFVSESNPKSSGSLSDVLPKREQPTVTVEQVYKKRVPLKERTKARKSMDSGRIGIPITRHKSMMSLIKPGYASSEGSNSDKGSKVMKMNPSTPLVPKLKLDKIKAS